MCRDQDAATGATTRAAPGADLVRATVGPVNPLRGSRAPGLHAPRNEDAIGDQGERAAGLATGRGHLARAWDLAIRAGHARWRRGRAGPHRVAIAPISWVSWCEADDAAGVEYGSQRDHDAPRPQRQLARRAQHALSLDADVRIEAVAAQADAAHYHQVTGAAVHPAPEHGRRLQWSIRRSHARHGDEAVWRRRWRQGRSLSRSERVETGVATLSAPVTAPIPAAPYIEGRRWRGDGAARRQNDDAAARSTASHPAAGAVSTVTVPPPPLPPAPGAQASSAVSPAPPAAESVPRMVAVWARMVTD